MAKETLMLRITIGDESGYVTVTSHYSKIDRCLDSGDARLVKELCSYLTPTTHEAQMRVNGIDYIVESYHNSRNKYT
jgi:hypothetical protein